MTTQKTTLFILLVGTALLFFLAGPANAQVSTVKDTANTDTVKTSAVKLKTVDIKAFRNTRLDSLFNRKNFANVYKYKGSGFMDLFSQQASFSKDYQRFQNSTSSIIGINLLNLPGLLGKKNNPTDKLKQTLIKEEKTQYVNRIFSKQLIAEVTGLEGDSLQLFQDKYRPGYDTAKQITTYELIRYIKSCLKEFRLAYSPTR